eukprot:jgi/Orpsp1_1/1181792/evm.model.c7180000078637.1
MIYPIQTVENGNKHKIMSNVINNSNNNSNNNSYNGNNESNIQNNKNKSTIVINPPTVKRRGGPREGAGRKRKNGPKALTYTPTPEVAAFLNIKKRRNESIQQIITRCIMEYKSLEMTEIGHRNE